ncbi:hypothetical protein [Georgenia thermotolerans]|uniref:hypothetical protein n=1 Tax=Georgenia thermotolerans TaxID=527326 RepID=UPI001264A547|nr:hypothetical protein [Georgenia thermotolerans]
MAPKKETTVSRIDRLRALADLLEASLDEATVGVRAQIAAQYRATLAEIAEIEKAAPEQKGTALDELNARRAAREAGASRKAGAAPV